MTSSKELKKLHIVKMFLEKKIKQNEAASLVGLSTRQIRRIAAKIKNCGDTAAVHKLRGKPSNRSKSDSLKQLVLSKYKNKYHDFGPTLASEKLDQLDGIKVSKETLRLWLISAGLHKKRRKLRPHRIWRQRKEYYGELVQVDGSHHDWFEETGQSPVY
jgi:hypothetical protein